MSGICAIATLDGRPVDPDELRAMAHGAARGPDGLGLWVEGTVGLAQQALWATPEAVGEIQPYQDEQHGYRVVADARLDRDEVVARLAAAGVEVGAESSDAALIAAAYGRWGLDCLDALDGDFAFVLWDSRQQILFGARDRFGIKPLYLSQSSATLCLGSQVAQLLHHPGASWQLDETTVAAYLTNHLDPTRTFFKAISSLPPAHAGMLTPEGWRSWRYWDLDPDRQVRYHHPDEYSQHFRQLFERAVAARLRTPGAPIGIALSGGLDSSSIAVVAHALLRTAHQPHHLLAYSYTFRTFREADEREDVSEIASHTGIPVHFIEAEDYPLLADERAFAPALDHPFVGWNSVIERAFEWLQQRGVRVLLMGHGGDSLVTGTDLVLADRLREGDLSIIREMARNAQRHGFSLGRLLRSYYSLLARPLWEDLRGHPVWLDSQQTIPNWIRPELLERTGFEAYRVRLRPPRKFRGLARQNHYSRIVPGVLPAVEWYDRFAAPFGIEVRHPFMDRRLAEFLIAIPPDQLLGGGGTKRILRRAMAGLLPDRIRLRREKTLMGRYYTWSLREPARPSIEAMLTSPLLASAGWVDPHRLREAYQRFLAGDDADGSPLFAAITLERWVRTYGARALGLPSNPMSPVELRP